MSADTLIYVVGYYDSYDAFHFVGAFSTETLAEDFIKLSKKPFYKDGVLYGSYRFYDLYCEEYKLDDFATGVLPTATDVTAT